MTEYVYDRFKRCVYHRVTHTLDAHADEYRAFQFVCETVQERKIKRIGWHRLGKRLFDDDSLYIEWRVLKSVVEQLNDYYDRHGRFPDQYTELVETPEPNWTLPYAPDKGDYHIHELSVEDSELVVTLNAPDTMSPDSFHDWTDHEIRFPVHSRFSEMVETGEVKPPTLHSSEHGYALDVPVSVPEQDTVQCLACGYTVNSDYNAAKNVGFRYLSEELSSPASHTCSSGQATSQLALMSGTLSPTGEFAEHDWVSTDKPHLLTGA